MSETTIYIIRHGQTDLNKKRVLQGRVDEPLNEDGIRQAEAAAELLRSLDIVVDSVWSSPLQRAMDTAGIVVGEGIKVHTDERLLEMDYGPYEGADLTHLPPEILTFFSDFVHNPAPDGMEQLSSVVERAGAFLEDIRQIYGDILISTHDIVMKGILEYLSPESKGGYWSKYIGNCGIYLSTNSEGEFGVPYELSKLERG